VLFRSGCNHTIGYVSNKYVNAIPVQYMELSYHDLLYLPMDPQYHKIGKTTTPHTA